MKEEEKHIFKFWEKELKDIELNPATAPLLGPPLLRPPASHAPL
jgi:hypothetical protein